MADYVRINKETNGYTVEIYKAVQAPEYKTTRDETYIASSFNEAVNIIKEELKEEWFASNN